MSEILSEPERFEAGVIPRDVPLLTPAIVALRACVDLIGSDHIPEVQKMVSVHVLETER